MPFSILLVAGHNRRPPSDDNTCTCSYPKKCFRGHNSDIGQTDLSEIFGKGPICHDEPSTDLG